MIAGARNPLIAIRQDSPPDKNAVAMDDDRRPAEDDLDYWARKLGVTREELRSAVQFGGPET